MPIENVKHQRVLEIFLVIIVVALTALLYEMAGYKMIVLNLFYLPVVLAGFFLGRYRGGLLALFCVIAASVAMIFDLNGFAQLNSPLVIGLAVILWGAVLGLTSLLVGTLSDERNATILELHEAYVGVVEVLARYLQSANPLLEARSNRTARLCQAVAKQLRLSAKQEDDIRVAALLYEMENIEITSRVIRKAVGNLEGDELNCHTFCGADLVQSLGGVLTGALPLLVNQPEKLEDELPVDDVLGGAPVHLGASILRVVRAYVDLQDGAWGEAARTSSEALQHLREDPHEEFDPLVLDALAAVLARQAAAPPAEPLPSLN